MKRLPLILLFLYASCAYAQVTGTKVQDLTEDVNPSGTLDVAYSIKNYASPSTASARKVKWNNITKLSGWVINGTTVSLATITNNVAIGTSVATSALTVNGTVTANTFSGSGSGLTNVPSTPGGSNPQLQYNNGGVFGGVSGSGVDSNGNLGLGVTTPTQKLHVVGNARITGLVSCTNAVITDAQGFLSCGAGGGGGGAGIGTVNPGSVNRIAYYPGTGSVVDDLSILTTDGTNIGVGSATPGNTLDVTGTLRVSGAITGNASTATLATTATALAANGANCTSPAFPLGVDASGAAESCTTVLRPTDIDTSAELINLLTDETGTGSLVFSIAPKFTGNVGINSTSPGQALDVIGTIRATAFSGDGSALTGVAGWTHSGTKTYSPPTDNVGVGTSLPTAALDVGLAHAFQVDTNGVLSLNGGATPSVSLFGQMQGDNNLWATGRGAPIFFDGTAAVGLVGTQISDTPTNGQVPTWNTGGTITWETPSAGGTTITASDTGVIYSDGANNPVTDVTNLNYNKTTHVLNTGSLQTATSQYPSIGLAAASTDTDWIIGVNGNGGTNDDPLRIGIGTTVPDMSVQMAITQPGNVGIGTSIPPQKLYVAGTGEFQGFKMNTASASGSVLVSNSVGIGTWMAATTLPAGGGSGTVSTGLANAVAYYPSNGTSVDDQTTMYINGSNVGIGSSSPIKALDIVGGATIHSTGGTTGLDFSSDHHAYIYSSSDSTGDMRFGTNDTDQMVIANTGNVGLGTYIAPKKLYTVGDIYATGNITCGGSCAGASQWTTQTNGISYTSNVGIGSTNPTAISGLLAITGGLEQDITNSIMAGFDLNSSAGPSFFDAAVNTGSKTGGYLLSNNSGGSTKTLIGQLGIERASSPNMTGATVNDIDLFTRSGAGSKLHLGTESAARLTVDSTGNIGIGTTLPRVQMEVKGGDFYVNTTAAKIHLREPDGTCCYLSASNAEALTCTSESCP